MKNKLKSVAAVSFSTWSKFTTSSTTTNRVLKNPSRSSYEASAAEKDLKANLTAAVGGNGASRLTTTITNSVVIYSISLLLLPFFMSRLLYDYFFL